MKSPFQRRTAFVAVLLAPALAACGFGAQTDQIYQAAQGTDNRDTAVKVLNAGIVAAENGTGTFSASLVNDSGETQTLTQVSGDGVTAATSSDTLTIAPQQLLNLGEPFIGPQGGKLPQVVLTGTPIEIGRYVRLTLTFSGVGPVTVNVQVFSSDSALGREYADVPLPPSTEPAGEATDEASVPSQDATEGTEGTEGTEESAEGSAE